jgi:hypothetical protein
LTLAHKVLLGVAELTASRNHYDWLGHGIYFWEHGPARAMQFASNEAKRIPSKVKEPGVLGAYIFLGDCFDLLDVQFTAILEEVYPAFVSAMAKRGEPLPENLRSRNDGTKLFHALDRAVIEFAIGLTEKMDNRKFDTVRGAFWEGGPAFLGSEISKQSHIQVAVRNPNNILGFFRPKTN